MTTIYWKHTPLPKEWLPQTINASLVTRGAGLTLRITFGWDRSHAFQSRGEIAVLDGKCFRTVLTLYHHDMETIAAYDALPPPKRGEFERAGGLPGMLRKQADELAELGHKIVGVS